MDSDNSDFWNEQLVPENFRVKFQEIFGSTSDDGGLVCGFNKSDVLSVIGTLPEELQQMLSVLLNQQNTTLVNNKLFFMCSIRKMDMGGTEEAITPLQLFMTCKNRGYVA